MILFQENGDTVTFLPESFTRNPPWQEKLFAFYLLVILIVLLARVIALVRCLWALRRNWPAAEDDWDRKWNLGNLRARSLRRLAILTFFLSILEISLTLTNDLFAVGTQKAGHSWWLLEGVAQDLTAFNLGIIVCAALYAVGFFFESRLGRHRLMVNTAPVPSQPPTD